MPDIVTIAGSPSSNSRSTALLDYAQRMFAAHGLRTHSINVRNLPPEDLLHARFDSPPIQESIALIRQARGVVIATPIYQAAYSGLLKAFLDLLPPQLLAGKLVLPIATGGSPVHLLAIDYALRPVLVALGAQHTLHGVYVVDTQVHISSDDLQIEPAIAERLDAALRYVIDVLCHAVT